MIKDIERRGRFIAYFRHTLYISGEVSEPLELLYFAKRNLELDEKMSKSLLNQIEELEGTNRLGLFRISMDVPQGDIIFYACKGELHINPADIFDIKYEEDRITFILEPEVIKKIRSENIPVNEEILFIGGSKAKLMEKENKNA